MALLQNHLPLSKCMEFYLRITMPSSLKIAEFIFAIPTSHFSLRSISFQFLIEFRKISCEINMCQELILVNINSLKEELRVLLQFIL